ncbi:Mu transposase C-terminal domain-containing protein [Fundidesulfovibrio butyratiphilus]
MNDTVTAKEIAEALGVTERTIRRRADREHWDCTDQAVRGGRQRLYPLSSLPAPIQIAVRNISRPALGVIQGGKAASPAAPSSPVPPAPLATASPEPALPPASRAGIAVPELPPAALSKAALKADLVRHYLDAKEQAKRKGRPLAEATEAFAAFYNSGVSWPVILAALGPKSVKSLERWAVELRRSGYDCATLAERYGLHRKGHCKVTAAESDLLLKLLLNQNQVKIGTAIEWTKMYLADKSVPSPSSPSTLRAWVKQFKSQNADVWTLAREGEKALIDKIAPYFERDISLLDVGDVLIADGHVCNFTVINPFTGKGVRPTLIAFLDWKSRDIVGYAYMLSEDIQGIHLALYRAILRLGKFPKVVYLDNGKGFKARVFTKELDLEQSGMAGLYGRLGIWAVFAKPYNARSKVIEPFFKTFSDHYERFLPSFSGASILDKPARMRRNEKFMQGLAPGDPISLEQAANAFESWLDLHYRRRAHSGLGKQSPGEVFELGRGPGVDQARLRFLMMHEEVATLDNNGVPRFGGHYWHEALYGLRTRVLIRYDIHDLRSVHVYDLDGAYICEAARTKGVHPMFALIGGKDAPGYAEFRAQKRAQEALKRGTKKIVAEAARQGQLDGIREVLPIPAGETRLVSDLAVLEAESAPAPNIPTIPIENTSPAKPKGLIDPTSLDWLDDTDLDDACQRAAQANTRR